jgi:replicative DNA helicase
MLSISDWAAQELVKLLPQAEELIKRTDNVREANIRRRLIKMAKYIDNAERKRNKLRMGKTPAHDS